MQEFDRQRNSIVDNVELEATYRTVLEQRTDWVMCRKTVGDASLHEPVLSSLHRLFKFADSIITWLELQKEMKTAEQDRNRESRGLE